MQGNTNPRSTEHLYMTAEELLHSLKGDGRITDFETSNINHILKRIINDREEKTYKKIRINGDILITDECLRHIIFDDCILSNLTYKSAQTGQITIKNSKIEGDLLIEKSVVESVNISDNSVTGSMYILDVTNVGNIDINKSEIKDLTITTKSVIGNLTISASICKDIKINNDSETNKISIKENSKIGSFRTNNSQSDSIIFYNSSAQEIIVTYSRFRRIEVIRESTIGRFRCRLRLHDPAQITFKDTVFLNEIDFRTSVWPEFATMQVTNCSVQKLHFDNFCNFGAIFFTNLCVPNNAQANSTLCLTNSDLGKLQFINCDLTKFKKFEFANTKMLEIFVAGSIMPDESSFALPQGSENNIYEQKRLAFGQFKKVYEGQGDVAGSLKYLAFEMDAYLNQLEDESKKGHENFGERWMLKLNRYSTNYGNDWVLGIKRTFFSILICYTLFCCFLGFKPGSDIARFVEIASYAPQYLNPFRDSDSVIPLDLLPQMEGNWKIWLPPFSRLIDYISRIVIAYFVYQTIQAFRKLGKSSG